MAFFSAKNAGLAFMILAVVEVIAAILMIILSLLNIEQFKDYTPQYCVIAAVGSFITACLYFTFGKKVKDGAISKKIDILAQYVKIYGIVQIIGGICLIVAQFIGMENAKFDALGGPIGAIVIGLIALFISSKINDGKQTTGDKIIWIILLVIFVLGVLVAIAEFLPIITIPVAICDLIIAVFMLSLLVDPEVKSEMNM